MIYHSLFLLYNGAIGCLRADLRASLLSENVQGLVDCDRFGGGRH